MVRPVASVAKCRGSIPGGAHLRRAHWLLGDRQNVRQYCWIGSEGMDGCEGTNKMVEGRARTYQSNII